MGPDYYTTWLGILPGRRPPDHYTLLGLKPGAGNPREIEKAAYAQLDKLDRFSLSPERERREACQRLMNEVAKARVVLMDSASRAAYDRAQGFAGDHGGMGEGSEPESSPALEAALRQVSAAPAEAPAPYELAPGPGAKRPGGAAPGGGRGRRLISAAAILAVFTLIVGGVAGYYLLHGPGTAPPSTTALPGVTKATMNTPALPALARNVPRGTAGGDAPPLPTAPLLPPPPSPAQASATLKTQTANVIGPESWPDDGPVPTVPEDAVTPEKIQDLYFPVRPAQTAAIEARIRAIMATPSEPTSGVTVLYNTGQPMLVDDFFFAAPLSGQAPQPRHSPYHFEWYFAEGRLFRVDQMYDPPYTRYKIWYNQRRAPVLVVWYMTPGKPLVYSLADYDERGSLRRTSQLNSKFTLDHFHLLTPVGDDGDANTYRFDYTGKLVEAEYFRDGMYYTAIPNSRHIESWQSHSRLADINIFTASGQLPIYPPLTGHAGMTPTGVPPAPFPPEAQVANSTGPSGWPDDGPVPSVPPDAVTPQKIQGLHYPVSAVENAAIAARVRAIMASPNQRAGSVTLLYGRLVPRFLDGFFPCGALSAQNPGKINTASEWRFVGGRLERVGYLGGNRPVEYKVWYDRRDAPVLVVSFYQDGKPYLFYLADYDTHGNLRRTCVLGDSFDRGTFQLFTPAGTSGGANKYTFVPGGRVLDAEYFHDGAVYCWSSKEPRLETVGARWDRHADIDTYTAFGQLPIYPRPTRQTEQARVIGAPPTARTPATPDNQTQPPEVSAPSDWVTLFRSDKPELWNTPHETGDDFALPFNRAPHNMRYLRLRRLDTGDTVIIEMAYNELPREGTSFEPCWQGTKVKVGHAYRLGIMGQLNAYGSQNQGAIQLYTYGRDARSGWGFGNRAGINDVQGFCWAGQPIDPTAMEVSVSAADLTPLERSEVLRLGRR